jgi:uncharacterized protein (TIGR00661 family)
MKIFYAIQATGNGHISRAIQLMPYLQQFGEVDIMLSGANSTLELPFPVKYKSKGVSLYYSKCGGLDYKKMWSENSMFRAKREAHQLPLEQYDIILNDFDYITALACKIKKLPSVQFGHQASFMSTRTPRPASRHMIGEMILKYYAPATHYVGLHFQSYDSFIFPPVIKEEILHAAPTDKGHITVYLPAYQRHCIEHHLEQLSSCHFHWFLPGISQIVRKGNISYYPVDNRIFTQSLVNCHGIITGGGFETPAEALYLGKKLLSIPIRGQYEQQCNAAALAAMGITTLPDADTTLFARHVEDWLHEKKPAVSQAANNVRMTLEWLMDNFANQKPSPETHENISYGQLTTQWNG